MSTHSPRSRSDRVGGPLPPSVGTHTNTDPQPPSAAPLSRDIAGRTLLTRDRKPDPSHPLSSHHLTAPQPSRSHRNRAGSNLHCRNRDPDPSPSLSNHHILHPRFNSPNIPAAFSSVPSPSRLHGIAADHPSSKLRPRRHSPLPSRPHFSFRHLHSIPEIPTLTKTSTTSTSSGNPHTALNPSTTSRSAHPRPPTISSTLSLIAPPHRRRTMRDTKPPATTKRDGTQAVEGRRERGMKMTVMLGFCRERERCEVTWRVCPTL